MFSIDKNQLLQAIEQRVGPLSQTARLDFDSIDDTDDLELLQEDLSSCAHMPAFQRLLDYVVAKKIGRLDGLRRAIAEVLNLRDDEQAQDIEEAAFVSSDTEELVQLLLQAVHQGKTAPSSRN